MQTKNEIIIRKIDEKEVSVLEEMLYKSIYQPDETNPISREVVNVPAVRIYIENFGEEKDDYCLVADLNGKIIGAVWVRILADKIKGYGYIDDSTPEFVISLLEEYRRKGVGTLLMKKMISYLAENGYTQTSLSVQKENYAVKLYKNLGFKIVDETKEDYIMLLKLKM